MAIWYSVVEFLYKVTEKDLISLESTNTDGVLDHVFVFTANRGRNVEVVDSFATEFESDIKSYFDNIGRFQSDKGKVGSRYPKTA